MDSERRKVFLFLIIAWIEIAVCLIMLVPFVHASSDINDGFTLARMALENPEKAALVAVIIAGVWRIFREIWKDLRGKKDETLIETLLRENHELRGMNERLRHESGRERRHNSRDDETVN